MSQSQQGGGAPFSIQSVMSADTVVKTLGTSRTDSPLVTLLADSHQGVQYVEDSDRVLIQDTLEQLGPLKASLEQLPSFELAGPRRKVFFDASKTRAGIVTCGGLCPGLNDVIRGLVLNLSLIYGVKHIYGFRNGYAGFVPRFGYDVLDLEPELVSEINERGGTILGSSRGEQDPGEVVDCLERMRINILFVIGGDGARGGACGDVGADGDGGGELARAVCACADGAGDPGAADGEPGWGLVAARDREHGAAKGVAVSGHRSAVAASDWAIGAATLFLTRPELCQFERSFPAAGRVCRIRGG